LREDDGANAPLAGIIGLHDPVPGGRNERRPPRDGRMQADAVITEDHSEQIRGETG
jgi:hypothetical protein